MKPREIRVNLWDLLSPVARSFDLMSPALAQHSLRVACLAFRLAEELGLPAEECREIAVAGALHDIGAFSLKERLDVLEFEDSRPMQHARAGYLLLRGFPPFAATADMVRFHHLPWGGGQGAVHEGSPVPRGSHVLHLADRAVVLVTDHTEVLRQVPDIRRSIETRRGDVFWPEAAEAFDRLAAKDYVWLEVASGAPGEALHRELALHAAELDVDGLLEPSRLLCRIIDFKSQFTATHSSGVAAAGAALARLVGFSAQECRMFEVAAYLHDLGKLAVPSEILEKPGKLTAEEWDVMRTHVYHTYQILCPIEALAVVTSWGALHQERLNGTGYPFRYTADDLPLGARIMAVADVFTGITEDRPYRKGMGKEQAVAVLKGMAARQELDPKLVALALAHYDDLDGIRAFAQARAVSDYEAFRAELAA